METLHIIKIGGNIIDDANRLAIFLKNFANIKGKKILVHGGGKLATTLASQLGIEQQLINGRRITDAETLKIITMVYAGYINKNIVAILQANGCNAIGLSGADGNLIKAHKRISTNIDYGFVGDVDVVNVPFIQSLLYQELAIVAAPVTHDLEGNLLNTNADTIAQEIAKALCCIYQTTLIYSFEKKGVLLDVNDENSVIPIITFEQYNHLKPTGKIFDGMIPKLDNAFSAIKQGVAQVIIGEAEHLNTLLTGQSGTTIKYE